MVHSGPKTRCGKTSPWMRYSPFTEELPKVLPWQAVGLMYFFSQMRPISSASFELSLGSDLSSMSWLQSPSDTLAGKRCVMVVANTWFRILWAVTSGIDWLQPSRNFLASTWLKHTDV